MDCELHKQIPKTNVNDNLIEQGIQFLICFCVFLLTCYTLYYLIISYRAGRIHQTERISAIVAFDVHSGSEQSGNNIFIIVKLRAQLFLLFNIKCIFNSSSAVAVYHVFASFSTG